MKKRRVYPPYKHLLGKELTYNGKKCFVAGINARKGITIDYLNPVENNKSFNHVCCLFNPKINYDAFWKRFCILIKCIEKGDLQEAINPQVCRFWGSTDPCAFRGKP